MFSMCLGFGQASLDQTQVTRFMFKTTDTHTHIQSVAVYYAGMCEIVVRSCPGTHIEFRWTGFASVAISCPIETTNAESMLIGLPR